MASNAPLSGLSVTLHQVRPIRLDLSFECAAGEVTALFGPSGSGKTTTLRAIAGLHEPERGHVSCNGETWLDTSRALNVPPHRRRIGLMFQEYALFPHLTVLGNVLAALGHLPRRERDPRACALLELVRLESLSARRPAELSGGQRQRVALARALARDPAALLLDEPFAAVDREARTSLYEELESMRRSWKVPIVLVTHDFEEVARLADKLVIIEQGCIVAQGPVTDLVSRTDIAQLAAQYDPGSVLDVTIELHDIERKLTRLAFPGGLLWAPLIAAAEGTRLRIRIPAREVSLALRIPQEISLHNVLPAQITALAPTAHPSLVLAVLRMGSTALLAQVTHDAMARLDLRVGGSVFALIKSVAVLRPGAH